MPIKSTFSLKDLTSFSLRFDKLLLAHIQTQPSSDQRIKKAMTYFVKTGGKRIRPFLIYTFGQLLNLPPSKLNDFALAIECVHLHSLIHDDLPAMDNDDFRRGKPTVHKKFDEATAVLAGDMFQVLSVKTLTESKTLTNNQKINAIQMLSNANGLQGLIAGQALDIYMKKKSTIKDIEQMYLLKTGALFSLCFNLITILKKFNKKKSAQLKTIGDTFGKIFQVTDDMLDRWGDEKKVGKKINKDSHKANVAYKLNRQECNKHLYQIQNDNNKALQSFFNSNNQGLAYMTSLVDFIVNRVK